MNVGVRGWLLAFKKELVAIALLSMVANVMMLAPSLYMLQVYDRVLVSRNELTLVAVSLLMLVFLCFMTLAEWIRSKVLIQAGLRLNDMLAQPIFKATFETQLLHPGAQPTKPLADLTELRQYVTGSAALVFFDLPWTPVFLAALFLLHPVLGWATLGFGVLQAVVAFLSHQQAMHAMQALSVKQQQSMAQVSANIRASDAVQAMGMLGGLFKRWNAVVAAYLALHAQAHGTQHRNTTFSKWLRLTQQSLVLGVGAWLAIRGDISAGAMVAANVLATRALAPVDVLVSTWRGFLNAKDAFKRITELLTEHAAAENKKAGLGFPPSGTLRLENISASPPAAAQDTAPILKNVNLTLECGKLVALIGPSGSGKSTLARVLLGTWPSRSGAVWWGTHTLDAWTAEELGPQVGYLPQDVQLFDGSIAQNIARQGELTPARVIEAAKMAGFHDAILHFPQGYDTQIGVGGQPLSGGQRQRLGLARALHGNPSLIVLDEPNANLDDAGEVALTAALEQAKGGGAAILVISHRPRILAASDRVMYLKDGELLTLQPQPQPKPPAPR